MSVENVWKKLRCPTSGEEYYYNSISGESQWDKPKILQRCRRASRVAVVKLQKKLQTISERNENAGSVSTSSSSYTPSLERRKKRESNTEQVVLRDNKHQELLDKLGALVCSNDIPPQKQSLSVHNKKRPDKRKIHVESTQITGIRGSQLVTDSYQLSLSKSSSISSGDEVRENGEKEKNHEQQKGMQEDETKFLLDKRTEENPLQQPTNETIYNPLLQPFSQPVSPLTKDYIALVKEYKRLEEYRSPKSKSLCLQCKVNLSNMVFFPCEHCCICDVCCTSHVRKRKSGLKCPVCKGTVKFSLKRKGNGREKVAYWKWVYEVSEYSSMRPM